MSSYLFNTPIFFDSSSGYTSKVKSSLDDFHIYANLLMEEVLNQHNIPKSDQELLFQYLEVSCKRIKKILDFFDLGNRKACIDELFLFFKFSDEIALLGNSVKELHRNTPLFRIRKGSNLQKPSGMTEIYSFFHIPFNQRQLISNGRFNSSGAPCLYFASNLLTAWTEMGKPDVAESLDSDPMNIGLFSSSMSPFYLDLSYRDINQLKSKAVNNPDGLKDLINYLYLFPLVLTLHSRILFNRNNRVNFRIEYFVPSLVMDWLFNQIYLNGRRIAGIKYSSVASFWETNKLDNYNYVFPTTFTNTSQYCTFLQKTFINKNCKVFYAQKISELVGDNPIGVNEIKSLEEIILSC